MTGGGGLALCGDFHREVVAPLVARTLPGTPYAAALIGAGSEVLGFDDATSTDHDWAPRVQLLLPDDAATQPAAALRAALDEALPDTFGGYPVWIGSSDPGAGDDGGAVPRPAPVRHRVEVTTLRTWMTDWFGRDLSSPWTPVDWLATPLQRLAGFMGGAVFHDDVGELSGARAFLAWYPDDVWRYLLASQWQRIAQLEPFTGRTGDVGDDRGSRLIAASLVRDLMSLAFLIERRYAPYPKWFGSAFDRLTLAAEMGPMLDAALAASDWPDREVAVAAACSRLVVATNDLGLAAPVDGTPHGFYDRPYTVIGAENVRIALDAAITDPSVRAVIARAGWVGGIDQLSDNVDLLTRTGRSAAIRRLWTDLESDEDEDVDD
ncbi:MAG TPA: DUF4037 domain-containing protein [Thermomicrobiales bacterium]|nr:DUF4037 domain-containing protein [Thermomicrobiales bacterium]